MNPEEVRELLLTDAETTYGDPLLDAFGDDYEDLYQIARFCLVLNIPYSEAKQMSTFEMRVFVEAHNDLQKETERAIKKR